MSPRLRFVTIRERGLILIEELGGRIRVDAELVRGDPSGKPPLLALATEVPRAQVLHLIAELAQVLLVLAVVSVPWHRLPPACRCPLEVPVFASWAPPPRRRGEEKRL